MPDDLSDISMIDLFRVECDQRLRELSDGLVAIESDPASAETLEGLMRAAHSLKGAARIVDLSDVVRVAHSMEDTFVAAQRGTAPLDGDVIDRMLAGVDLLRRLAKAREGSDPAIVKDVDRFLAGEPIRSSPTESAQMSQLNEKDLNHSPMRDLRVDADQLNRLLGSAAESRVCVRRMGVIGSGFNQVRKRLRVLSRTAEAMLTTSADSRVGALQSMADEIDRLFVEELSNLEEFEQTAAMLAERLYGQALDCRMRPLAEILPQLRRGARDAGRALGREVRLDVVGESTQVDRDLLERLEAPLLHLIRNAVDHGIESPDARMRAGKPRAGRILIEASHRAGYLILRFSDDGAGVDLQSVRARVVKSGHTDQQTAGALAEAELLEFLFLPGFSMKPEVTEISGRGVGLDVVQSAVRAAQGRVRIETRQGKGTTFALQVPISLSVLRALHFEIEAEPYAIPLARVERVVVAAASELESVEGCQYLPFDGQQIAVVDAATVLGISPSAPGGDLLHLIILRDESGTFAVSVSRFLGEGEVVVQPLDPNLGRLKNFAATALNGHGEPILIIDVDDFLLSVSRSAEAGLFQPITASAVESTETKQRVLVVDDSLTVRELERKLITLQGYEVAVAVDGADAWNALRTGQFDAVVTDVDMPRMDGIELTGRIKQDARLRDIPVIIVSYKDRAEDRRNGLQAGADYYLTKSSFQDEGLARALADVLGHSIP